MAEGLLLTEGSHGAASHSGARRVPHLGLLERRYGIDTQELDLL